MGATGIPNNTKEMETRGGQVSQAPGWKITASGEI